MAAVGTNLGSSATFGFLRHLQEAPRLFDAARRIVLEREQGLACEAPGPFSMRPNRERNTRERPANAGAQVLDNLSLRERRKRSWQHIL